MADVNVNHFDRSKPFYPLVMHYVAQLVGVKELCLRGLVGGASLADVLSRIPSVGPVLDASAAAVQGVREGLRKLTGPLQLRSEAQGNCITVDIDEVAREFVANPAYLLRFTFRAAGVLLVLAHDMCKKAPWHDTGPLWEFLKHCRNAAAHNGILMVGKEPNPPARWRTFKITRQLHETPLFKDAAGAGLLSAGDPIRLLWDIEQAYPLMSA
jgi:hypothetical protein